VTALSHELPRRDAAPAGTERLGSLDAFRGVTIAAMILVNNAGDWDKTYAPLLHAEWNGWTPTDLVFPFFLFAVGIAIPYAFAGRLERSGGDRGPLHRQIVRRTAILFALGLFLNWFPFYTVDWPTARIPGVLVAGLLLARWFPINKNLWTSTYVVFTSGMALLLLAAAYFLVDIKGRAAWVLQFTVFGTNAIAFFGSTLMAKIAYLIRWPEAGGGTVNLQQWLFRHLFASWLPDYVSSLTWALLFTAFWWGVTTVLYRRRIFLKI
jgi:predicted acyltransferase